MFSVKITIKLLTLLGLIAGLIGAMKLFNSIKSSKSTMAAIAAGKTSAFEAILDENLSKTGIKLIFWGFIAQFSAVFCQLFYY